MTQPSDITGASSGAPVSKKRGRRLYSLQNIRTLLADVLRQVEADAPEKPSDRVARARVLIYGAQVMGELIRATDIEERLAALEGRKGS